MMGEFFSKRQLITDTKLKRPKCIYSNLYQNQIV